MNPSIKKAMGITATLEKKLGLKDNYKVRFINEPEDYLDLFEVFPYVEITESVRVKKDFIHLFCETEKELKDKLPVLKNEINQHGMIWVSWPKKATKPDSKFDENSIRQVAIENDMVDIKVCSVNETWSAIKLVIPVKLRKNHV